MRAKLAAISVSEHAVDCDDGSTYFCPRHPLGPSENGCDASLISLEFGSNHLDGTKVMGFLKFLLSCVTVQALV